MTAQDAAQDPALNAAGAGPAREAALDALLGLTSHGAEPPDDAIRTLADWCRSWRAEPPPAGLKARPCPLPAARWHFDQVTALGPAERDRRAHHARMLGHLLAPRRADLQPRVSVLIPVYNRAGRLANAVESCLAQDWRPFEVVVVDDGSSDDPASVLQRFGDIVRLHRKPNGGVASARNAGIPLARGDFIHFLDSDNLLMPGAISRKLAAFRAIADAELCYCAALTEKGGSHVPSKFRRPDGGEFCATTDFLRATVLHYPFLVSCAMLPRWVVQQADRFEEDLRRSEDYRYWFSLALRGTKAVAIDEPLLLRGRSEDSLNRSRVSDRGPDVVTTLRGVRDILSRPEHWIHAGRMLARLQIGRDHSVAPGSVPLMMAAISDLRQAVQQFAERGRAGGLSPLPVLVTLRQRLARKKPARNASRRLDPLAETAAALTPTLSSAIRTAPALTTVDLGYWTAQSGPVAKRNRICGFLSALASALGDPDATCREATLLLRVAPRIPTRRGVERHLRLRRRLGATGAMLWLRARAGVRRLRRSLRGTSA